MNIKAFMGAIKIQVFADLRPYFRGFEAISLLITPLIVAVVLSNIGKGETLPGTNQDVTVYSTTGVIAAFSSFIIIQLSTQVYQELIAGTLLRVRTMPKGALMWAISNTLSGMILTVVTQLLMVVLVMILNPGFRKLSAQLPFLMLIMLFMIVACAPLGLLLGCLVRGTYSSLLIMGLTLVILVTSGAFFPLSILPKWVQAVQLALPIFWSSHLARVSLLGSDVPNAFFSGTHPLIAIAVLVAWMVLGYPLAALAVKQRMKHISLSELVKVQAVVKTQLGM